MESKSDINGSNAEINLTFLKNLTSDHVRQIIALYKDAGWWATGTDDQRMVECIVRGSHCFLVASDGARIVGMGRAISDRASDAYIQDVTVQKAYQHKGIATRIIDALVKRLHRDGLFWIALIAERNTDPLYRRIGFEVMPDSVPMLKERP